MTARITHGDWHGRHGRLRVTWQRSHYEDINWVPLPPLTDQHSNTGFRTQPGAYALYGDLISGWTPDFQSAGVGTHMPTHLARVFDPVVRSFDLRKAIYTFGRYTPGQMLPWHTDLYPTYMRRNQVDDVSRVVRVIVFLADSEPGQQLWIEDRMCYGPAGSWFSWQGSTKHMAANLSESDRYMMQITGVVA
jgi:hypothetical protein